MSRKMKTMSTVALHDEPLIEVLFMRPLDLIIYKDGKLITD